MQTFQTLAFASLATAWKQTTSPRSVTQVQRLRLLHEGRHRPDTPATSPSCRLPRAKASNDISEKFVCTGTYFYLFNPEQKEIQARELPRPTPGAMPDDNFLGMFGLRVEDAKRRYNLKLAKQDDFYIYIDILPRFRRDQAEFEWARIVLNKSNFVPATAAVHVQPGNNGTQTVAGTFAELSGQHEDGSKGVRQAASPDGLEVHQGRRHPAEALPQQRHALIARGRVSFGAGGASSRRPSAFPAMTSLRLTKIVSREKHPLPGGVDTCEVLCELFHHHCGVP